MLASGSGIPRSPVEVPGWRRGLLTLIAETLRTNGLVSVDLIGLVLLL
jgi:hypothetical protein